MITPVIGPNDLCTKFGRAELKVYSLILSSSIPRHLSIVINKYPCKILMPKFFAYSDFEIMY